MSIDDHDPLLLELAARVADAADVDWSTAREDADPTLTPRLDHLASIARIAAAFRTSVGPAADDAATPTEERSPGSGSPPAFRWGGLLVHEKIGEGSFGEVYRAVDPRLRREVALKLRPLDRGSGLDARRFLDEARRLARVSHPNVIAVHGADIDEGRAGLWTELVRGKTLEHAVDDGPLDADEVIRLGRQLCAAVGAVHGAGLVHGDITARNVIVDGAGEVRLADFGSASDLDRAGSGAPGTPLATAPEVLAGAPPSPRSDLYAVAALCFRLLTGRMPVEARDVGELLDRHRAGERTWLRDARPELSPELIRAIDRSLSPDPDDRAASAIELDEALAQAGAAAGSGASARGGRPSAAGRLPAPRTSFVGRDAVRRRIDDAFGDHRWVTLVGTGGAGKTRLAVESSRERSPAYPDGVWFVPLADLRDGDDVGPALAAALGLDGGDDPLGAVLRQVRTWQALLILDNLEHVLDPVATAVTRLLDASPRLHVLGTSREPVDADGERLVEVGGLSIDPTESGRSSEAEVLFHDRLRAVRSGASGADPDEAPEVVADLLRWTGGLPLAIELVAAAARTTSLDALRDELTAGDHALRGRRGAASRHASIDAVVAWSHRRLDPRDRDTLESLAVFRGGATLDGLHAVLGGDGPPDDTRASLERLERASLVVAIAPDRWTELEPVRQFAERRLDERGELTAARTRHLHHLVASVEAAPSPRDRAAHTAFVEDRTRDRDNHRAALGWAAAADERHPAGRRLVAGLGPVWSTTNPDRRLLPELERLTGTGAIEAPAHARTVCAWVAMSWPFGDHAGKVDTLRRAAAAMRDHADVATAATVYEVLGRRLGTAGHLEEAREALEHAGALADKAGDPWARFGVLQARIGWCVHTGHLTLARELIAEARALGESLDDPGMLRTFEAQVARVAYAGSDYERAARHEARALELVRAQPEPNPQLETAFLKSLAVYVSMSGDRARAMDLYRESLALARRHGFRVLEAAALASLGEEARRDGDPERAIVLLDQALEVQAVADEPLERRNTLLSRAWAGIDAGRPEDAGARIGQALELGATVGGIEEVFTWFFIAQIAAAAGHHQASTRLMGAVERGCEAHGVEDALTALDDAGTLLAGLREALGDARMNDLLVAGRGLDATGVGGLVQEAFRS